MPNRIEGSSLPVAVSDQDEAEAKPDLQKVDDHSMRDVVAQWASPAASEAVDHIESSYGSGWLPDMGPIDDDLSKLSGFDLLDTMNRLDHDQKLEPIIRAMTPDERQHLINDAVSGRLLERKTPQDKLEARLPLPHAFDKMVDDLNALQGRQKHPHLEYRWSGIREDPSDLLLDKTTRQIDTLEPGDSQQVDLKVGAYGAELAGHGAAKLGVARDAEGRFAVWAELGAEAGVHAHLPHDLGKAEGSLGAAGRVEYRFATATEAKEATDLLITSPELAAQKYGRPAAVELDTSATAELQLSLGTEHLKLLKLAAGEEGRLAARYERDGAHAALVLRAELKGDAMAGQMLEAGPIEAFERGREAKIEAKLELEYRLPITDPDAFENAPAQYLKTNGEKLSVDAELQTTLSNQTVNDHQADQSELRFTTHGAELKNVIAGIGMRRPWTEIAHAVGRAVEVDFVEKRYALEHRGADFKVGAEHLGVEFGGGYELKRLQHERPLYRGTLYDFVSGKP
jgi:hypothetical protein